MTPEKSKEIEARMIADDKKAMAEAVVKFGLEGAEVCSAIADLLNQMRYFVHVLDADLTAAAGLHATCIAVIKRRFCEAMKIDQKEFEDMALKIATTRMFVHRERALNG